MLTIKPATIGHTSTASPPTLPTFATQIAERITDRSQRVWTMSKRLFKIWY